MEKTQLISGFRNSFVATGENIEKLVNETKDWKKDEMASLSIALGMTAGSLYILKMESLHGIKVSI